MLTVQKVKLRNRMLLTFLQPRSLRKYFIHVNVTLENKVQNIALYFF